MYKLLTLLVMLTTTCLLQAEPEKKEFTPDASTPASSAVYTPQKLNPMQHYQPEKFRRNTPYFTRPVETGPTMAD